MRTASVVLMALLGLSLVVGTSIGGGDAKKEKVKGFLRPGWKDLNLSAEQKERVYKIQMQFKAKLDELKKTEAGLKAAQLAEEIKVLTEDQKDQLRKALTGEAKKDAKRDSKKDDKK